MMMIDVKSVARMTAIRGRESKSWGEEGPDSCNNSQNNLNIPEFLSTFSG